MLEYSQDSNKKMNKDNCNFMLPRLNRMRAFMTKILMQNVQLKNQVETLKAMTKKAEAKPPRKLVMVLPENEEQASMQTKEVLQKTLNPVKEGLQIKNMYSLRNASKIHSLGLQLEEPHRHGPQIMVYNVSRELNKEGEWMETIDQQNCVDSGVSLDALKKDMMPRMKKGDRSAKSVHILFECSAQLRKKAIDTGKLYIGFACCRVKDFIEPLRCYRCQRYGHLASKCKWKEAYIPYVQRRDITTRTGRRKGHEHVDHRDCPAYTIAYEMEIAHGSAVVHLKWRSCQENMLDVVLFHKPYFLDNKVMNIPGVVLTSGKIPKAGIWVRIKATPMIYEDISTQHHLEIQLMVGDHQNWDKILDKLHNKETVIASDVNAKSTLCQAGHLPMYVSPTRSAETFIDVTLATSKASQQVLNWEVVEDSSSGHRLILYEISPGSWDIIMQQFGLGTPTRVQTGNYHRNEEPWGLVYRVIAKKMREITPLRTVETVVGQTSDITETISVMIEALLPGDSADGEMEKLGYKRGSVDIPPNTDDAPEFTAEGLDKVVKELELKKAPGYNNITAEIVKGTHSRIRTCLLRTYNELLRMGRFPECWKKGILWILYKGSGRDPKNIKSYQPLMLLATNSTNSEGVETELAVLDMVSQVRTTDCSYAIGIFLNIAGAFYSAWWTEILWQLKIKKCPRNLYAADGLVLILANSRKELESKAEEIMHTLDTWSRSAKMKFAVDKTKFKYLGVVLDSRLSFMEHIRHAYRTVSTEALTVLARVLQIDLFIRERGEMFEELRVRPLSITLKREYREHTLHIWQDRWDTTEKGREVFRVFPDVNVQHDLRSSLPAQLAEYGIETPDRQMALKWSMTARIFEELSLLVGRRFEEFDAWL
ncbi:hypothetical protein PR048_033530 [Dryococelus australis]|uniref:CCHC-type domain-containing protein n=1 Tax=Dryococelus australis TaxID=614101 RepID=A0ABQ9G3D2_9NEOP|nr:hypothetical protein PR048_033530 [Dryococelus australis]